MKYMVCVVLLALLLVALPAHAENMSARDSVGLFQTSADGGDFATTTRTTYAKGNTDHAAGDQITLVNTRKPDYRNYEAIKLIIQSRIYDVYGGDTLGVHAAEPSLCESDADTFTNFCEECCTTAACTAGVAVWLDDSTSYADSNTGYIVVYGTNADTNLFVATDTSSVTWTLIDSIAWTSSAQVTTTLYPNKRFLKFRSNATDATEDFDTIGTAVWIDRLNSWPGPEPDYLGFLRVQKDAVTDTLWRWVIANDGHEPGQLITIYTGDDDVYTKVAVAVSPLATASADPCSTGGYLVLEQSLDLVSWVAIDSMQKVGGGDPDLQVIEYDTLAIERSLPYVRFCTQEDADSTDISTPAVWEVWAKFLR